MTFPRLVYVYDAHCSWCYAFVKELEALMNDLPQAMDMEIISGGMVVGEQIGQKIPVDPKQLLEAYDRMETINGTKFSEAFMESVKDGTVFLNSELPAAALSLAKQKAPEQALDFVHLMQDKLFQDAWQVNEDRFYFALAAFLGMELEDFVTEMSSVETIGLARYDFALAKQLQVSGFPQLFVQTGETNFHLIAKGFTPVDYLKERLDLVLKAG